MNKEDQMSVKVRGFEIQIHHQVIGALLKKMGTNEVELDISDVGNVEGIIIFVKNGKLFIKSGGCDNG